MKYLLALLLCLGFSTPSLAKSKSKSKSKSVVNGYFGYGSGGIAVGGDYEMKLDKVAGWGGYGSYYASSDEGVGGIAAGAFLRQHIRKKGYDFHLTGGFGVLNLSLPGGESKTAIGPTLGLGGSKKYNKSISVGFEMTNHYGWFNSPTGLLINGGLMSLTYKL